MTNSVGEQLRLIALLHAMGVNLPPKRTKLVRHQDYRYNIPKLLAAGQLDIYQDNQGKPVFQNCDSILTFSADGGRRSEFLGLYHIRGVSKDVERRWPTNFIYRDLKPGPHWYQTEKDRVLRHLEQRLVIDWGGGTRAWHQWLNPSNDKLVIEIKAPGRHMPFTGYDDVVLSFADLSRIVANPASNLDWMHALSKVTGVYLIQDVESGDLYVGSAYGISGIWGRWTAYVESRHGGNVRLRDLCDRLPQRHNSFKFSILKTMPLSADKDQVLSYEATWKQKLGTRAYGLNSN